MRALVFGASGGLAAAVADHLLTKQAFVDLVTRKEREVKVNERFAAAIAADSAAVHTVGSSYVEYKPQVAHDLTVFTQALFNPTPLVGMEDARIEDEITVGLTDQIRITRALLLAHPPTDDVRRDFCFTGSTSSYAGFRNTTVYCAVKHALVGFVRAMNEEYSHTNTRFWLFSMGSMDTEMGHNVPKQDRLTFLQADDVARRIVSAVTDRSNMFEPEVLIRRRTIRHIP